MAENPTPARRGLAALIAGALAFLILQLLFGVVLGAGSTIYWLSALSAAVAAGYAAATLKRGLAITFGVLAGVWLFAEAIAAVLAVVAAGTG